jgi:SAM-dependent methyltransferase
VKPLYVQRTCEDLDWWNLIWAEHFDSFEGFLPLNRRRILDVGSGHGYFLLHGRGRGWDVTGIEPSTQAAEYTRQLGLRVVEQFLTPEIVRRPDPFDVVHCSDVL